MKQKIKNLILSVCTWKFCMWINIVFAVCNLVFLFICPSELCIGGVIFFSSYAFMAYILNDYEVRHRSDVFTVVSLGYRYGGCLDKLERYKKIYGELPSDTSMHLRSTTDKNEEIKKENSVEGQSLSMEEDKKGVENKSVLVRKRAGIYILNSEEKFNDTLSDINELNNQVQVKTQRKKRAQKPKKTEDVNPKNSSAVSEMPKQKRKNSKEGSMAVKSSNGVKRRIPRSNVSSVVDNKKKEAER